MPVNPYVINWTINFLSDRKQRVVVDGIITKYVNINRGVSQGSVLRPILFSIMINNFIPVYSHNQIVKFADHITLSIKVDRTKDTSDIEAKNIMDWASNNGMSLNLTKTWEMVIHVKVSQSLLSQSLPNPLPTITRKTWLKILGITFQDNPCNWDMHFEDLISKASSRMYIMRICKYYGLSADQLDMLFHSLIISLFLFGIEVCGGAYKKYLRQIDRLFKRAFKYYLNIILLPKVGTERFKFRL